MFSRSLLLLQRGERAVCTKPYWHSSECLYDVPGVGLTCLSARCLSSYLIFPPVPVTSSCGRSSSADMRREALRISASLISPLVCQHDLDEAT